MSALNSAIQNKAVYVGSRNPLLDPVETGPAPTIHDKLPPIHKKAYQAPKKPITSSEFVTLRMWCAGLTRVHRTLKESRNHQAFKLVCCAAAHE
jgi:hypothetical protein